MNERNVDWGATGRRDVYSYALVDPFTLSETGPAQVEAGGASLTWSYDSDNQAQGSIPMRDDDYQQDGYFRMVRVYDSVTVGEWSSKVALATLFVSNASTESKDRSSSRRLSCYGPMWRFTQDYLDQDFVARVGDNVCDQIRSLIEDVGGIVRFEGVDMSRTHTRDVFFPLGCNRAETIYTYAGWIGAEVVTEPDGSLLVRPYESFDSRAPVYTFEAGRNCVYLGGIEWETNRDEPRNRVVAYFSRESKQDDDPYPLADSVTLDLPSSYALSYERCGRRTTHVLQVTDPCSHEDLQAQAQRYMEQSSGAYLDIIIEHVGVPFLRVGDCVDFENEADMEQPFRQRCVVMEMSVQRLGPGCITQSKLRTLR